MNSRRVVFISRFFVSCTAFASWACTTKVNLPAHPSTQSSASSTGAKANATSSQDRPTGSSTSATTAPPPKGSAQAPSTSSASSDTSAPDSKEAPATCEASGEGRRCVQGAPSAWEGPVALIRKKKLKELLTCNTHDPAVSNLYDKLSWEPAHCSGCQAKFDLPECKGLSVVMHEGQGCKRSAEKTRYALDDEACKQLPSETLALFAKSQHSFSLTTPVPTGQPHCYTTEGVVFNPPVKHQWRYRGCYAQAKGACEQEGQVCGSFSQGPACIYREGLHECPTGYDQETFTLYADVDDQRGCTPCETILKDGKLTCSGTLSLFDQGSCESSPSTDTYTLGDLAGQCWSGEKVQDQGWTHAQLSSYEAVFSGYCSSGGWEPKGKALPKDPVTVCCQDPIKD